MWIILGIIAFIVILLHFSIRIYVDASKEGADIKVKYLFFTVYKMNTAQEGDTHKKKKADKKKKKEPEKAEPAEQFDDSLTVALEELDKLDEEEEKKKQEQTEAITEKTETEPAKPELESEKPAVEQVQQKEKKKLTKEQKKALKEKKKLEKELKKAQKAEEKAAKKAQGSKLDKLKTKYQFFKPYIGPALKAVRKLLKKIRIKNFDLELYTAKEDPSESAIFYGKLQPIVFNALSLVAGIFTLKVKRVDITCGFFEKKLDFHLKTKVLIRPSTVIHIGFCLGVKFLRLFLPGWWKRRRERKKARKAEKKARRQAEREAAAAAAV